MKLLARYRRHNDTSADAVELLIEAADYSTAVAEARARTADGDNLLSVQSLED